MIETHKDFFLSRKVFEFLILQYYYISGDYLSDELLVQLLQGENFICEFEASAEHLPVTTTA